MPFEHLNFGPPRDLDAALAVLREAALLGVNHIDTSDFYGPHITNQTIRIVTKVGARRRRVVGSGPVAAGADRRGA